MIQFIVEEKKDTTPLYKDVKQNQFFISSMGSLCQKINEEDYVRIADAEKKPNCSTFIASADMTIRKILPETIEIKF